MADLIFRLWFRERVDRDIVVCIQAQHPGRVCVGTVSVGRVQALLVTQKHCGRPTSRLFLSKYERKHSNDGYAGDSL